MPQANSLSLSLSSLPLFLLGILLILLTLTFVSCGHKNTALSSNKNWPYVAYASAHLYTFNSNFDTPNSGRPDSKIVLYGQINGNAADKGELNTTDLQSVCSTISQTNIYVQEGLSSCFIPRHGIVFFDEKGAIVANLNICFECEAIKAEPTVHYSKRNAQIRAENKTQIAKAAKDIAAIKQLIQHYVPIILK